MKKELGFSLIEFMIVVGILLVSLGVVFTLTYQGQRSFQNEAEMNDASRQARMVMDQITRYIRHAGNAPVTPLGVAPIELLGGASIRINADITGAVASTTTDDRESTGDPDGTLNSIHEQVTIRYDAASQTIFMDIGYGEEVAIADNVADLTLTFYDISGAETTNENAIVRAEIVMAVNTGDGDVMTGRSMGLTLRSEAYLRSRAFGLFGNL